MSVTQPARTSRVVHQAHSTKTHTISRARSHYYDNDLFLPSSCTRSKVGFFTNALKFGGRSSATGRGVEGGRDPLPRPPAPPSRTHEVTVLQLQASEYRRGECTLSRIVLALTVELCRMESLT